jgi:hypothetical protein
MGFLNHIPVLNIKIIRQINLFLIFLKKTIDKYKIKSNFMCFSVALFYNYFLCGKRAFLCGESNSSINYRVRKFDNFVKNFGENFPKFRNKYFETKFINFENKISKL